jgi:hypothetical protein
MYHSSQQRLTALLGMIAMTAFAVGCGTVESGTVLDVTEDSVVVADDTSFTQTTYRVAPDANILKDGEQVDLGDLEQGDDVNVTVAQDTEGNEIATSVSAESNEGTDKTGAAATPPLYGDQPLVDSPAGDLPLLDADPNVVPDQEPDQEPSVIAYQGEVMDVEEDLLTLVDPAGTELAFFVDDLTKITLNGEEAELSDVESGFMAIVTAREDLDELIAVEIEAASLTTQAPLDDQETEDPGSEPEANEVPDSTPQF